MGSTAGHDDDVLGDPELLEGVRRRDAGALERFFDAAFPFVYAVAVRLTRDRTAAEDVTQDALQRIHGAADRLDPARSARPWLAVVTTNVFRDRMRRRGRRREVAVDPGALGTFATTTDRPERRLERREQEDLLERAMNSLDEESRTLLVLRAQSECSYEEIGEVLGIRPTAARKRYSRALGKVRELVRRHEP